MSTALSNLPPPKIGTPSEVVYPTQPVSVILPSPTDLKPIYTPRLILRPTPMHLESQDPGEYTQFDKAAEGVLAFRGLDQVTRWLYPPIPNKTVADMKNWLRRKIFTRPDAAGVVGDRHFHFLIVVKDQDDGGGKERIVGTIGVNSLDPAPSIGYGLHPDVWGLGYATEAARAFVGAWWALPRVGVEVDGNGEKERLFAATNCANVGSFKVLQRVGFEVFECVQYGPDLAAFLEMRRPDVADIEV
ncbi:GNAT domain-containing protein [Aspergillus crustosus]